MSSPQIVQVELLKKKLFQGSIVEKEMELINEFIVTNLATLAWSGGVLLISQGLSTMTHRRRNQQPAGNRGVQDTLEEKTQ